MFFSKVYPVCHNIVNRINQEVTQKRLVITLQSAKSCLLGRKVIDVRCIICSHNNIAKGISFHVKRSILFIQEKIHTSKSF